ncbi:MarR family transcriptional regulator [Xanthomonas cerealis pv. cerealis]|uniref:MarR family winged helix-turn-helix transcriptional regulator n=2 Tax=Xanthomonas cerealis TaxID=3390025 RepID=UPI001F019BAC|nr:MarR family transcriptional regulator [Xanthomonas translucens]UKE68067.1 MarR family transcriptional regulator [Xanthomonas translucens pv. pistacia]
MSPTASIRAPPPPPPPPRDAATVVRLIKLLHKLILDQGNDMLRAYGLNYSEYTVLMMIDASPDGTLSPSQLSDAASEESANITRLSSHLVDKRMIQRVASAEDRRVLLLCLIAAFMPDVLAQLSGYTQQLQSAELAQLETLLKKLLRSVEGDARAHRAPMSMSMPARLPQRRHNGYGCARCWPTSCVAKARPGCSCCAHCCRSTSPAGSHCALICPRR